MTDPAANEPLAALGIDALIERAAENSIFNMGEYDLLRLAEVSLNRSVDLWGDEAINKALTSIAASLLYIARREARKTS